MDEFGTDINVGRKNLIDRQQAIDALVKAIREDPYYDSNEAINGLGVCDVRVILNDLPSAQPKEAIPISWIEGKITRFIEMDNAFSGLTVSIMRAMVNEWKNEQKGEQHG